MDSAAAASFRNDVKVIGVVSTAHGLSHFFQLALPPLFPFLKAEFGTSYATLGALVSVFYVASGICQFGAGFAVDRYGARPALLAGIGLLAGGAMLAGFVPDVYWLFPICMLMGLGNGVFHPADFAVMNANVSPRRLGHAYSTHGMGGSLGYAIAPVLSYGLASMAGWRMALITFGLAGLVGLAVLATQRETLQNRVRGAPLLQHTLAESFALFRQSSILLCFAYFCVLTIATVGLQTFTVPGLNAAYGVPLAVGTSAITAYLLGSTAGILTGGFLAAHTARHDRVAASGIAVGASVILMIALAPALAPWAVPLFAITGFSLGATGPSRDMIVRNAAPRGASGRVYGFVYSGLDLGSTLSPVAMGLLLDHGSARIVFASIACFMFLAIATVVQVRRSSPEGAGRMQAAD